MSEKEVKYMTFNGENYNSVEDICKCYGYPQMLLSGAKRLKKYGD
jgi:hypothetical protein